MEDSPSGEANRFSSSQKIPKKFPTFFGTLRFITALTSARHLSLSSASTIQSMPHILLPEDPYSWFCTVYYILHNVSYALIWYYKAKLQFKMNTL
jgi:hypothetical protein